MHETLLSTSSHRLAQNSVNRLEEFPNIDQSHPALAEARRTLLDAEERLWQRKFRLQSAFAELVEQAGGSEGHALDASIVELDEIKARMARLEDGARAGSTGRSKQPLPPLSAPPPDPPPLIQQSETSKGVDVEMRGGFHDPAVPPPRGQPIKFKDALRDVMKRLTAVEETKAEIEGKCEDLEGLIWSQAEEKAEKIMFWGQLEQGRIKQRKRRRSGLDGGEGNQQVEMDTGSVEVIAGTSKSAPEAVTIESVDRDILVRLDGHNKGKEKASHPEGDAAVPVELDTATSAQIRSLQMEIKVLKEALQEVKTMSITRDRALVQAAVQGMRSEYSDIVKKVRASLRLFPLVHLTLTRSVPRNCTKSSLISGSRNKIHRVLSIPRLKLVSPRPLRRINFLPNRLVSVEPEQQRWLYRRLKMAAALRLHLHLIFLLMSIQIN